MNILPPEPCGTLLESKSIMGWAAEPPLRGGQSMERPGGHADGRERPVSRALCAPPDDVCPACGSANWPRAKFCSECGQRLLGNEPNQPLPLLMSRGESRCEAPTERRQLTVMFYDLAGSTTIATALDPEDLREVIGAFHRCITDEVSRLGGFVARYVGDGALVYFGYPEAHESGRSLPV